MWYCVDGVVSGSGCGGKAPHFLGEVSIMIGLPDDLMIPVQYVSDASDEKVIHILNNNDTSVCSEVCPCNRFSLEAKFCKIA
jgi:hypothetical protein